MKSPIFWFVTPCSLERPRRFGGTCRLLILALRISHESSRNRRQVEDGGDMFLRNARLFSELHGDTIQKYQIKHRRGNTS
jgi:hypothetical protein